jgi:hypothetical protein
MTTEDAMRDALKEILTPEQRTNFMSLFQKFMLQKQKSKSFMTALDNFVEPSGVLYHILSCVFVQ